MIPMDVALLQEHCPIEVVEYITTQDMTTTESLFWPDHSAPRTPYQYHGNCHLAAMNYVVDRIDLETSEAGVRSFFLEVRRIKDYLPEGLRRRIEKALERLATRKRALNSLLIATARLLHFDLREQLALHVKQPLTVALLSEDFSYQNYAIYLAEWGDENALAVYTAWLNSLKSPREIRKGLALLHSQKPPNWEMIVRPYINDPRQEIDQWGGRGGILAQSAREMLDLPDYTGPKQLKDNFGRDADPQRRPFETEAEIGKVSLLAESYRPRPSSKSPPPLNLTIEW